MLHARRCLTQEFLHPIYIGSSHKGPVGKWLVGRNAIIRKVQEGLGGLGARSGSLLGDLRPAPELMVNRSGGCRDWARDQRQCGRRRPPDVMRPG